MKDSALLGSRIVTCSLALHATIGSTHGETYLAEQIKAAEPHTFIVNGQLPGGWQVKELPAQRVTLGPFVLPNGQQIRIVVPACVLEPAMTDPGAQLYMLEPGFDADTPGSARSRTICELLAAQLSVLKESGDGLEIVSNQIKETLPQYTQNALAGKAPSDSQSGVARPSNPSATPSAQSGAAPGNQKSDKMAAGDEPVSSPSPAPSPVASPAVASSSPTPATRHGPAPQRPHKDHAKESAVKKEPTPAPTPEKKGLFSLFRKHQPQQ